MGYKVQMYSLCLTSVLSNIQCTNTFTVFSFITLEIISKIMAFGNDIKVFTCQEPQHYIDISSNEDDELMWDQWEVTRKLTQDDIYPINPEALQEVGGAVLIQEWEQSSIQCTELQTTGDLVINDFYIPHLSPDSEYCFT